MVQLINTVDANGIDTHDVTAVNKAENRSLYAARVKIHPTVNKISLGDRIGAFLGRQ